MKASDYNYFIHYKDGHIFFNGITKRFFLASDKNHAKLMDIISRPDDYRLGSFQLCKQIRQCNKHVIYYINVYSSRLRYFSYQFKRNCQSD